MWHPGKSKEDASEIWKNFEYYSVDQGLYKSGLLLYMGTCTIRAYIFKDVKVISK